MAIITQPFQRTKVTGYNTLKGWVLWYTNNISIKPLYKKALTIRSLLSYPRPSPFSKVCAWRSHTLLRRRCPWLWESLPWLQSRPLVVSWAGHGPPLPPESLPSWVARSSWRVWASVGLYGASALWNGNTGASSSEPQSPAKLRGLC